MTFVSGGVVQENDAIWEVVQENDAISDALKGI